MAASSKQSGWDAQIRHEAAAPPSAAASLYATSAAVTYLHQPGTVIAVCLTVAIVGGTAGVLTRRNIWMLVYTAAAVAFVAAWFVYTQLTSPFTHASAAALAMGLGVLWPGYWFAHHMARRERRDSYAAARDTAARAARKGDWPTLLAELGCHGVTVEETRQWRAGYTQVLRLPAYKGMTVKRIQGIAEAVEVALDVPRGRVRVEEGPTASIVLVHVVTRDVLAEIVPLPFDGQPRSINDPIGIGISETGEILFITLREVAALAVGVRGSGKSNLLNVLISLLANCVDVLIWVIDLKGGRTAKPWLRPWLDKKTERPVIDWVATTRDEAALMLGAALAGIDVRSNSGAGGEKITPSAEQPAIIVICEEVSALVGLHATGSRSSTDLLTSITQLGRSEAIDPVLVTQRGTVTMTGSGDLKSQLTLRIALGGGSIQDAQSVLGDSQMARIVANLKHKGTMCVQHDEARPIPAKVYRVEYEEIYGRAEACSWMRPGPEESLEAAWGAVYAERWSMQRAGHLLGGATGGASASTAVQDRPGTIPVPPMTTTGRALQGLPVIPPPPGAKPTFTTAKGQPIPRAFNPQDFDGIFDELRGRLADVERDADVHPGRTRMLGLLIEAGAAGLGVTELTAKLNAAEVTVGRQAVHTWLDKEIAAGNVRKRGAGDYIHKDFA